MTTVYFIRHGETNYNVQGLCNSAGPEVFLTPLGIGQVQALIPQLSGITFDQIIISPTHRTKATFSYLNILSPPPKEDTRISELKTGLEGQPIARYLELIKQDSVHQKLPGGESFQEVYDRVRSFIEDIKPSQQTILVVTHSIILKAVKIYQEQLPLAAIDTVAVPKNGEILKISWS
jgi:broad specificity phosphatase PhoE